MQYYQCDKYPIEFVLSENIDKHFDKAFQRIVGISPSEYARSKKQIEQDT